MPGGPFVGRLGKVHTAAQVPRMHGGADSVRVKHREYIQDISSTTAFSNRVFTVNPGLSATFPWLSSIAQNFEQYRFRGLAFEFVSTSADSLTSATTNLGEVIMTAEYNVSAAPYVNLQQMLNAMWSTSCKPSTSQVAPVECDGKQNPIDTLFVRTGPVPTGQDQRFFDMCNMQVATDGCPAANVIGQLWVTYDVELLKPQLVAPYGDNLETAAYNLLAFSGASPLGSTPQRIFDSIGVTLTGTQCQLPVGCQGDYLFMVQWSGTTAAVYTAPVVTVTGGTKSGNFFFNNAAFVADGAAPATADAVSVKNVWLAVQINIPNPTVACSISLGVAGTLPGGSLNAKLLLTQVCREPSGWRSPVFADWRSAAYTDQSLKRVSFPCSVLLKTLIPAVNQRGECVRPGRQARCWADRHTRRAPRR
jgi:hypothetical protein